MTALDETHDPKRKSWVASAEGHPDFPIQNLPLGIFSPPNGEPRGGVATIFCPSQTRRAEQDADGLALMFRRHRRWRAGASRRWFRLANPRPKRQSQLRNLVIGLVAA